MSNIIEKYVIKITIHQKQTHRKIQTMGKRVKKKSQEYGAPTNFINQLVHHMENVCLLMMPSF